jgi:hypothetical protein
VRLALYLGRRRKGDTAAEAARFTNRHLFDYGDLTQFEKSVLRRVLPFYTFTARNTPQQVRALLERPGKYANLEKVREEARRRPAGPGGLRGRPGEVRAAGRPDPGPRHVEPALPEAARHRPRPPHPQGPGQLPDGDAHAADQEPVELDQNYSFFLRRKIDELSSAKGPNGETVSQLKPAPPVLLAAIKKAGPLRGTLTKALHLQQYTDKRTGKKVIGWPAKVDYVWRMTPATTFAGQAGSQIPNTRGQSPARRRSVTRPA